MRAGIAATVLGLVTVGLTGCGSNAPAGVRPSTVDSTSARPSEPAPSGQDAPSPNDPLPSAADGTDLAACADGNCEVLIEGPADVLVLGTTLSVVVNQTDVTFVTRYPGGGSSSMTPLDASPVTWSNPASGKSLSARFLGVKGGKAVVRLSTTG